mgnify:CR=1 FL=1
MSWSNRWSAGRFLPQSFASAFRSFSSLICSPLNPPPRTGLLCHLTHIGSVAHFVDVGVTRNVKGCQKLQSGRPTHFVDQHICWCGWCSVTVQFVASVHLNDTICWCGDVFRINILRKRPILLVHLINIHNGYAFRINILYLQNQHSGKRPDLFTFFGTLPYWQLYSTQFVP